MGAQTYVHVSLNMISGTNKKTGLPVTADEINDVLARQPMWW